MVDLGFRGVAELRNLIVAGEVTAREVLQHSLDRIAALDPVLNAFAWVRADEALAEADELDREQAAGRLRGPLHGVPIAIKDENDVAGLPTAYGGASVTSPAAADSELVRRLRAAGAVIVGKTRMPEFGIWPWTETSANGYTRNPWNPLCSPAGSSGGTAAAVASGMVPAGIGGDGGGSIRLPSSFCGLFGLKPQRGRISAAPNADLWRSLGVLGPLTRSVADSALIYDAVAGSTAADRFTSTPWQGSLAAAAATPPAPLRIGLALKNPSGGPAADAETIAALRQTAVALRELGHEVVEITPKYPNVALPF
ncbi:MAG: amidase family protein, partial [Cryobacterium sp.]